MGSDGLLRLAGAGDALRCEALALDGDDTLRVQLVAPSGAGFVEVAIVRGQPPGPAFLRLPRCTARYRGRLDGAGASLKAAVGETIAALAAAVDARLEASPGATLADALGRARPDADVAFGRETLRALLAPELVAGVPVAGGFVLADVYPSSALEAAGGERLELVLDFRRDDGARAAIVVGPRREGRPAFAETAHLALRFRAPRASDAAASISLRALVAFVLQLRDHPEARWTFPAVDADLGAAALPAAAPAALPSPARWLNLAVDADCGQACSFCSVKALEPPSDGGDATFARLAADLAAARARGGEGVRGNRYDPRANSRILDGLRHARARGFARAEVYSPCTRLADRAFCVAVVEALPPGATFAVPLYAADAATHDRVVGAPGAFAKVEAALANLEALAGKRAISLLSVATRENLAALPALLAWAERRGLPVTAHLPYPSHESRADRFYEATPRQEEVARALLPRWADGGAHVFPVGGVAPCVAFRVLTAAGIAPKRFLDPGPARPLPGAEYATDAIAHGAGERETAAFVAPTVACPHAGSCVLAASCGGRVLRAYVELHGADELAPVSLAALLAAS